MIEIAPASSDHRPWLICEPANRWRASVATFWPVVMPPGLVPTIESGDWQSVQRALAARRGRATVVLWDSNSQSVLELCDWLLQGWHANPAALQLVAATGRSRREQALLLELPCAALVWHVEDLPKLRSMIHAYLGAANKCRFR